LHQSARTPHQLRSFNWQNGFMTVERQTRRIDTPLQMRVSLGISAAILIILAAAVFLAQPGERWLSNTLAAVMLTLAVLITYRGLRARIDLHQDELVVHDWLFTRHISRSQVISVDRFPWIDWRGSDGRPREILVNIFLRRAAGLAAASDEDRAAARATLEAWLAEAPPEGRSGDACQ
jgi:hypothetical protein